MRRLWVALVAAILVSACSAEIPRHPAAYVPPPPTEQPAASEAAPQPSGEPAALFDTSAWQKLSPAGESFSILMPGKPEETSGTVQTPGGDAKQTTWAFADSAANRTYNITRVRMTHAMPANVEASQILDVATDAVGAAMQGAKVSSKSDVTIANGVGRRVVLESATAKIVCEIVVAKSGEVFTPCVAGPTGVANDGAADAFLASLAIG